MSRRIFALLPFLCALSCASQSAKSAANETPEVPLWSGTWTRLDDSPVPQEKVVVIQQHCPDPTAYWKIEQDGNSITLEYHESPRTIGVATAVTTTKVETAHGARRKNVAHLEGHEEIKEFWHAGLKRPGDPRSPIQVTYELEWDPKTEHLIGTRNGDPVRFVRAELTPMNPAECPPVP
jgi:hypothetical protein